jgi:ketosteroid isomerase-like protein
MQSPRDTARAVSQEENVERVVQIVEAMNSRDFEAAVNFADPDIEWITLDAFPDAGTYRGPEAVLGFFQAWMDMFDGFRMHLKNCGAIDERLVLARLRVSGEVADSGAVVESPEFFQLLEFRDRLVIRAQMFRTEAEALEAAGLSE